MRTRVIYLGLRPLFLVLLASALCPLPAARVRLEDGMLRFGEKPFRIKGVRYAPASAKQNRRTPSPECQLARDLPLIAATGANTVRTLSLKTQQETTFISLLETTGLYWLAGFSLEPYYDPERTLASRREEILEDFRKFAERHQENQRLLAFVVGEDVTADYHTKFAGEPADFYALLSGAAEILTELSPENPPMLAAVTGLPEDLRAEIPGLSFWIWKAAGWEEMPDDVSAAAGGSQRPVLVEASLVPVGEPEGESGGETDLTEKTVELIGRVAAAENTLGFVYPRFAGEDDESGPAPLFHRAGGKEDWESLQPQTMYRALEQHWEGHPHDEMAMGDPAVLERVFHAATGEDKVAPGALARVSGAALSVHRYTSNGIPWPLHQGETCLCLDGRAVRMGMIAPDSMTIQVPWESEAGEREAVYYRGGVASAPVPVQVEPLAPGIFPEGVVREEPSCVVSASNGVRPGEKLTVFATGLGPGDPSEVTPKAFVNGREAEVLYSGLAPAAVGMNRVDVRVDPETAFAPETSLVLVSGEAVSPPYRVRVERPADVFRLELMPGSSQVILQAGGPPAVIPVRVEGLRGYCGPARIEALGVPQGVTVTTAEGFTGQAVSLSINASEVAPSQDDAVLRLRAWWTGVEPAETDVRLTVLPSRGQVTLAAFSNGYKSGYPRAQFRWNGKVIYDTAGGGPGRGINVLAVDPRTGVFSSVRSFDTWADEAASEQLVAYLESLPDGALVLFAVADDAAQKLSQEARATIARLFFSRYIWQLEYQDSWVLIGRKGWYPWSENWSNHWGTNAWTTALLPLP